MNSRQGSHAEALADAGPGGRGGGIRARAVVATALDPVATPEGICQLSLESALVGPDGLARSIPVTRSISHWLHRCCSSVAMVVCLFGFETFTPCLPLPGRSVNVLPTGADGAGSTPRP
jgi:hypothetical protein